MHVDGLQKAKSYISKFVPHIKTTYISSLYLILSGDFDFLWWRIAFVQFLNKCLFLNMKMGFLAISYIFKFAPHTETYILSLYSMLYDNFDFLW